VPDLLFGSNVVGSIRAAGHDPVLVGDTDALHDELGRADALIVDLTADASDRMERLAHIRPSDLPTLAFYSHVETHVRKRAEEAGFELVVPRSRMARDGAPLVQRLVH
jgi:hypothetical protein